MDLSKVGQWDVLGLLVVESLDLQFGFGKQAKPVLDEQRRVCIADAFEGMAVNAAVVPDGDMMPKEAAETLMEFKRGVFKAFGGKVEENDVFDGTIGYVLRQFLAMRSEIQKMADEYIQRKYKEHWEAFIDTHWRDPKFGELRESMSELGVSGLFEMLYSVFKSTGGIADRESLAPVLAAWRKRVLGVGFMENV